MKEKIRDMKNRIQAIASVNAEGINSKMDEKKLLQVLNYAGLSGLVKLKTIGETKAMKILHEREDGLFSSVVLECGA